MEIMLALGLAILLMSNIWLLREHEKTRSRLEQYRAEVSALDDRVYQILLEIDLRNREEAPESLHEAEWDEIRGQDASD